MNNQKKVLVLSILCMVILLISSSYAIMTNFTQKEDAITFTTGNLEMTILNGEETFSLINLNNRLPESDTNGLARSTVVPITLKNTGTMLIGEYTVKLISDPNKISTLSEEYIRFSVSEDNVTYSTPSTLTDNENIIFAGKELDVNQTKTFYLKMWLSVEGNSNIYIKDYYGSIQVDLYQFVEEDINGVDKIINKYGIDTTLVAINTDGTLYDASDTTQIIREYRYSGATANNYVVFDINDNKTEDDNEIWRIVGAFKDDTENWQLKLVRNTILSSDEQPTTYKYNNISYTIGDGSTKKSYYNKKSSGTNNNDWTTAGIQYFLNTNNDANSISGYYSTFADKTKLLIDNLHTYYLGNFSESTTTKVSYTNERNKENITSGNKETWNGAIGLLYASDIGYSASSSYWSGTNLSSYATSAINTSWLYKTANHEISEWIISPLSGNSSASGNWLANGALGGSYSYHNSYGSIRPCLYLNATTKIEDAEGTESDPYKVIVE